MKAADRLGSEVQVSANFQIFALTAGGRGLIKTKTDPEFEFRIDTIC